MVLISTAISTQAATLDEISMWNKQRNPNKNTAHTQYFVCILYVKNTVWTERKMYRRQSAVWNQQKANQYCDFHFNVLAKILIITQYKEITIFDTEQFASQTHTHKQNLCTELIFTFQLICLTWNGFVLLTAVFLLLISVSAIWLLIHLWTAVFSVVVVSSFAWLGYVDTCLKHQKCFWPIAQSTWILFFRIVRSTYTCHSIVLLLDDKFINHCVFCC